MSYKKEKITWILDLQGVQMTGRKDADIRFFANIG